jgi:hypothetical protein
MQSYEISPQSRAKTPIRFDFPAADAHRPLFKSARQLLQPIF